MLSFGTGASGVEAVAGNADTGSATSAFTGWVTGLGAEGGLLAPHLAVKGDLGAPGTLESTTSFFTGGAHAALAFLLGREEAAAGRASSSEEITSIEVSLVKDGAVWKDLCYKRTLA